MNIFYTGAARIEKWFDQPKVARVMDAASIWYIVFCGLFVMVVSLCALVALALTVVHEVF